jgi:hypothetical protein
MELIPYLDTSYSAAPFKRIIGHDITANLANYYLFKEQSLLNYYVLIYRTLAPEMKTRISARLEAMQKTIFYHLITDGELTKKDKQLPVLNTALKAKKK